MNDDEELTGYMPDIMRVCDMLKRPGLSLESRDDGFSESATLFHGRFWQRELRRGLVLHASDVLEEPDFTAHSAQHAGISCIFFLEGEVDVEIGDRRFAFQGSEGLSQGMVISSARAESFRRVSRGHQRIRHLVISASPEWLDRDGLHSVEDAGPAQSLMRDHLASATWQLTPRLSNLVRHILLPPSGASLAHDLQLESASIEIIAEALAAATRQDPAEPGRAASPAEQRRLSRALDFIGRHAGEHLPVERIAREAGISVSGLQRAFKAVYGLSVMEHIRRMRLERAMASLRSGECSVSDASIAAGYASPANFATAFKRAFGITPTEAAGRSR